jgi:hypothetical protein
MEFIGIANPQLQTKIANCAAVAFPDVLFRE